MTAYLEWHDNYFVINYEDVLTIEQAAVLYSDILTKNNLKDMKYAIVNTTKLNETKYDDYDYERHAALTVVLEKSTGVKDLKVGVVATSPKIIENIKKLKEKTKTHHHSWHRKIFSSVAEATSWCKT